MEREPSCELMVFWRVMAANEDPEADEAREGVCNNETAMTAEVSGGCGRGVACGDPWRVDGLGEEGQSQSQRALGCPLGHSGSTVAGAVGGCLAPISLVVIAVVVVEDRRKGRVGGGCG